MIIRMGGLYDTQTLQDGSASGSQRSLRFDRRVHRRLRRPRPPMEQSEIHETRHRHHGQSAARRLDQDARAIRLRGSLRRNAEEELLLFLTIISIPDKIEYNESTYQTVLKIRRVIDYIYKSRELVKEYGKNIQSEPKSSN